MTQETGRLVEAIEVKNVGFNGESRHVVNNTLAIRRTKDITTFLRFTAWGASADFLKAHFKKGDPVTLVGEIRNDTYEKDDVKVQTCYLLVEKVVFVPQNKNEGGTV